MTKFLSPCAPLLALLFTLPLCAVPHWEIQYRYQQLDSTLTINDFVFPSAKRGVACGFTTGRNDKDKPIVLATADAGAQWTEVPVKESCISLFFLDDSNGWMVTDKGIWVTGESGRTWRKLSRAPSGMLRAWFLDAEHGFLIGSEKRIFETIDRGESWTLLPVVKDVQGDSRFTTFGEIVFSGRMGMISGWNIPPRPGGPAWMSPADASRRLVPHYSVILTTTDGGKTWKKSEASIFGQNTRISMAPPFALGLTEFKEAFEYPSDVSLIDMRDGKSERAFRQRDRAITDVRLIPGSDTAYMAGYATQGTIARSPVPGKLKIFISTDRKNWKEMPVDYRAVAHSALIAAPDETNAWVATDTGMILKLVND